MISYILLLLFSVIVYRLGLVHIIKNTITIKQRKLKNLSTLVRTQYKNIFTIFWICLCIVSKNFYISLLQTLNNNIVIIDKHTYELNYVIKGRRYTMRIKCKKGPHVMIQASDENDNDITEIIQAYAGPMEDFHGIVFTPNDFGHNEVTLSLSSGDDIVFNVNQPISLPVK